MVGEAGGALSGQLFPGLRTEYGEHTLCNIRTRGQPAYCLFSLESIGRTIVRYVLTNLNMAFAYLIPLITLPLAESKR